MPSLCQLCLGSKTKDISKLDYQHCSLIFVPETVVEHEKTLEELILNSNSIKDLPRSLFHCQNICKFEVSDNDLCSIPNAIGSLVNLEELDVSKNGITDLPENIKFCKKLQIFDISVNPLGRLPDAFTHLLNLTQVYLNDTFLEYLPANFGRLIKLKILEIRENHLKLLPRSMSRLTLLERLDAGHNDFEELPEVIGSLFDLKELWLDSNFLSYLPWNIGNLKKLVYLDVSKNRLKWIPSEIGLLESLTDCILSNNNLHNLHENIGKLNKLTILRLDDNQLTHLPNTIGGMTSLEEFILSYNDLEEIPNSIGLLRHLRNLNLDYNLLLNIPSELGSCSLLRLLSVHGNHLETLPDELGRLSKLSVLTISDNKLKYLPYSFTKLKNLQALWMSDNQSKPLIPLQADWDIYRKNKVLTCFMFPQQPRKPDEDLYFSDAESFHLSTWEEEREQKKQIVFDVLDSDTEQNTLRRIPTPFPKEAYWGKSHRYANGSPKFEGQLSTQAEEGELHDYKWKFGSDIKVREAKVTKPGKPGKSLGDSHFIFRADKEKMAKDKARIRKTNVSLSDTESSLGRSYKYKVKDAEKGWTSDTEIVNGSKIVNRIPASLPDVVNTVQQVSHNHKLTVSADNVYRTRSSGSYNSERLFKNSNERKIFSKTNNIETVSADNVYRPRSSGSYDSDPFKNFNDRKISSRTDNIQGEPPASFNERSVDEDVRTVYSKSGNADSLGNFLERKKHDESLSENENNQILLSANKSRPPPPSYEKTLERVMHSKKDYTPFVNSSPDHDSLSEIPITSNKNVALGNVPSYKAAIQSNEQAELLKSQQFFQPIPRNENEPLNLEGACSNLDISNTTTNRVKEVKREKNLKSKIPNQLLKEHRSAYVEEEINQIPAMDNYQHNSNIAQDVVKSYSEVEIPINQAPGSNSFEKNSEKENESEIFSQSLSPSDQLNKYNWRSQILNHLQKKKEHSIGDHQSLQGVPFQEDIRLKLMKQMKETGNAKDDLPSTLFPLNTKDSELSIEVDDPTPSSKQVSHSILTISEDFSPKQVKVQIFKNPGLGFSICGGIGSPGNPFKPNSSGIFVTKIQPNGPASHFLKVGDHILKANGIDFTHIEHEVAVSILRKSNPVDLIIVHL